MIIAKGSVAIKKLKKPILLMTASELCSYIKYLFPREKVQNLYSQYVALRGLIPDIHMDGFKPLYEKTKADDMMEWIFIPIDSWTHKRKIDGELTKVDIKDNGVIEFISQDSYGSYPTLSSFLNDYEEIAGDVE